MDILCFFIEITWIILFVINIWNVYFKIHIKFFPRLKSTSLCLFYYYFNITARLNSRHVVGLLAGICLSVICRLDTG